MEADRLMNGTYPRLIRMSVWALTSTRLLCAPFKFLPSLTNFHTLPRSYPSSFDLDLLRGHDLKLVITRYGSMKYLIWGGKDRRDLGACVILHNHLRVTILPIPSNENDGFTHANMTVQPGLELRSDLVDVVSTDNMLILRMYLVYVDTSLVPNDALGLDIAVKCSYPLHLFNSVL